MPQGIPMSHAKKCRLAGILLSISWCVAITLAVFAQNEDQRDAARRAENCQPIETAADLVKARGLCDLSYVDGTGHISLPTAIAWMALPLAGFWLLAYGLRWIAKSRGSKGGI